MQCYFQILNTFKWILWVRKHLKLAEVLKLYIKKWCMTKVQQNLKTPQLVRDRLLLSRHLRNYWWFEWRQLISHICLSMWTYAASTCILKHPSIYVRLFFYSKIINFSMICEMTEICLHQKTYRFWVNLNNICINLFFS